MALAPAGFAAVPTLDHLFPVAVQAGTTSSVTVLGKFEPWPPRAWTDAPGVAFRPETNAGRFTVEVAADTPAGPHFLRVFNGDGASAPRFLLVTREPQTLEQEPNDDFAQPQKVERLPASVNGRLEKSGDVDSYAVTLEAGQTLVASVEAFTLASPVDAVLRVVDARGTQVAWNHDGRTLDPELVWTASAAGTYVVQVFGFAYPAESDVRFTGNARCVYRLQLARGPWLRHTLPLGVRRGARANLKLAGWNLGGPLPSEAPFDATALSSNATTAALRLPGFDNAVSLLVGDGPELLEQESSDAAATVPTLETPGAITGRVDKPGDEDRCRFTARKGEKFQIEVHAARLGFPVDAWLRVEDGQGKELARNDDTGGPDPRLEWTAPADGDFVIAVGNVVQRGGPDAWYRLSLQRAMPAVKLTVADSAFTVKPGATNEVKVALKRLHGFKGKLDLIVRGLPDGARAIPAPAPEKDGDWVVQLTVAAGAKAFAGPIRMVAMASDSGREHPVVVDLTSATENNGVPGGFTTLVRQHVEDLWLTIPAPAPPKTAAAAAAK